MSEMTELTVDEVEEIILKTEPATMSDKGDKIWTRRMAVALSEVFNDRIRALSRTSKEAVVRGLEWHKDDCGNWYCDHAFGGEFIQTWTYNSRSDETFSWGNKIFDSADEAKAAAQADFEECIRSALKSAEGK